ncbi:MAG: fumarylacetoacetate hydrolase family protein [Lachnospiraceae bacterium]|nr:fumarylacetoacetate hydrolase family protein [Lachnospiraceae bacterium]
MKLITYGKDGEELVGVLTKCGENIIPLKANGFNYNSMNHLIEEISKEEMDKLNSLVSTGEGVEKTPVSSIQILAPIPQPKQDIICLGINYMEHAVESVRYKKEAFDGDRKDPVYFSKRVNRASADGEDIPSHSDIISTLDYEAELGVIIGKDACNVKKEDAFDYVFGYTIINDVTARELQTKHKQWYFGKGLDGFTPMGPVIVTADEISAPPVLTIKSWVNGELRQNSKTNLFIHDIPYMINELSQGMTLKAGTIIATGTPAGVGMGFVPPKFLVSGDVVECEIEGIGKISNKVK